MKISLISLLLILWLNCIVSLDGLSPLIQTLGSALLPIICNAYSAGTVPSVIEAIYGAATGGAKCKPVCTKPEAGGFIFSAVCDASSLSDDEKDNYCQNGVQATNALAKLIGCEAMNCVTNADGNFSLSVTCAPARISLASLTSLL